MIWWSPFGYSIASAKGTEVKCDENFLPSYLTSLENTNDSDEPSCEGCKGTVVGSKAARSIYGDGTLNELMDFAMVGVEKKARLII